MNLSELGSVIVNPFISQFFPGNAISTDRVDGFAGKYPELCSRLISYPTTPDVLKT